MNLLDIFEGREPHQQAIDRLEQARIDHLKEKMDYYAEHKMAKEFATAKAELQSYYKIKDECMGYGSVVGEAGIGQDIANKTEKLARATPQTKAGAVASTVKNAAKWLAGRGGPGQEGPTYESQKQNSKQVNEYISMGSDKNYAEAEPYKNYKIYVRKKPFGNTGMYTAHTEIDRKEFMGKGGSQEQAVQAIRDRIDFVLNAQKKVTGSSTIDFNVKFATDLLADPRQAFYAKLENINGEPKLVIASPEVAGDPELVAAGDFKRSAVRNQVDDQGRATPLPGIPLTAKSLRSGDWIANGRYTIGNETTDRDGNRVFDLTYHSTAHTKSDKLRLNQPAFTLGTAREVDEGRMGEIDAQRQDLELMSDRQFLAAYGMSKQAFEQRYRALLKPALDEARLAVGDPVVVTAANEFEGSTGEIYEFSPSGKFVVVDLYNHGRHSMHLSDVAYNDYADQEETDDWYDDNVGGIDDGPQHAYDSDERTRSDQFEGSQDFGKKEPYEVCLAGKCVKTFDRYADARRFHDNWKAKLYREGNKAKADSITLNPVMKEAIGRRDLLKQVGDKLNDPEFRKTPAADPAKRWERGDLYTGPGPDDPYYTKNFGHGYPDVGSNRSHNRDVEKSLKKKKGVAEGHADQQRKIFKKNGEPVGEVGIDRESSPGNGPWYVKHYASGYDVVGFDSYEEAVAELKHCLKQGVAEGIMDVVKQTFNDNVAGWPMGTSTEQFIQGWAQDIKARTGKTVPVEKLAQLYNNYVKRSGELMQSHGTTDEAANPAQQAAIAIAKKKEKRTDEDQDTSGVESAILRRIMVAHTDLLMQFGPEKVMQAAEEVADNVGAVDEIGTSDVSAYVQQVKQILGVAEELDEKWSQKYKSNINCANPKGFSQRAHCAGKKK
jgi:hypothetical protein